MTQQNSSEESDDRRAAVADVVAGIAREMRRAEIWEVEAPSAECMASTQPFCFDTMSFHQWLQWQFLPRITHILDADEPLPDSSAILPYAEEFLPSLLDKPDPLLFLLRSFDELITRDWPAAHLDECQ
jgi:uncharacterized protein YqcC (DUF446 family)